MTVVQIFVQKKYVGKQKPMIVSHYFGYRETFFFALAKLFFPCLSKVKLETCLMAICRL